MGILSSIDSAAPIRVYYNVETMLDNFTGRYLEGCRGDYILNGGMSQGMVVSGRGNTIKTGTLLLIALRVLDRYPSSEGQLHDTEDSLMGIHRIEELAEGIAPGLVEGGVLWNVDRFSISDSSNEKVDSTTKWWKVISDALRARIKKNTKDDWVVTPFKNPTIEGKAVPIKVLKPFMGIVDSISKANLDVVEGMEIKHTIDDKERNILAAREGLIKTRMIREMPRLAATGGAYWLMSAHMGDFVNMGNPMETVEKKLTFMRSAVKFKGFPEAGTLLTSVILYSNHQTPLQNKADRTPEYPLKDGENAIKDPDLLELHMMTLRSKVGRTGLETGYVYSQSTGFNIPLSHFHAIRKNRFGISGKSGDVWYSLILYPEAKISRSTVRDKLDGDYRMIRALELTVSIMIRCSIDHKFRELYMTEIGSLEKLYEMIEASPVITWEEIYKTREWWSENDYNNPLRRLSTLDVINIAVGAYVPYWKQDMPEFKEQVKRAEAMRKAKLSNLLTSTVEEQEEEIQEGQDAGISFISDDAPLNPPDAIETLKAASTKAKARSSTKEKVSLLDTIDPDSITGIDELDAPPPQS